MFSTSQMKLCDLTQFYSPLSGGVKRYVHEKIAYIQAETQHEHKLVVPGPKTECVSSERSRIYFIHSPLISRTSHYRALVNLRAIEQILEREQPDLIESGDPYQVAWKAIASGEALRIPVVGFYHSHFAEAYVRSAAKFLGQTAGEAMMDFSRRYVRNLYNSFEATLVPSARLGAPSPPRWRAGQGKEHTSALPCFCRINGECTRRFPSSGHWRRPRAE